MSYNSILNLCGGKIKSIFGENSYNPYFLLNLDQIYFTKNTMEEVVENHQLFIDESRFGALQNIETYINFDAYQFLERYNIPFDLITIYRFLEHVPKSNVLYFIYLLSTCTEPGAMIDVIVPDYRHLAERILNENPFKLGFESEDIITTYELLNDMPSPHLSIWTDARIKYFFELEGRFKLVKTELDYKFDGRSIYLRSLLKRV